MRFARYTTWLAAAVTAVVVAGGAAAQESGAQQSLDELLQQVQQAARQETARNRQREAEFRNARNRQQQLLGEAQAELQRQETLSDQLKTQFDENEKALAELETVRQERLGNLGEMFGVVRQVAGDTRGKFESSMVTAQYPDRIQFLRDLGERKELPRIPALRQLWFEMQREITEQGKIVSFTDDVLNTDGARESGRKVSRVGVFNAVSDGKFLVWTPPDGENPTGIMAEIIRPPAGRWVSLANSWESAGPSEVESMAVDFTSGAILSLVVQEKTLVERIQQGGTVGYVIIGIGLFGLALAIWRAIVLFIRGNRIKAQLKKESADKGNALGRIMSVYEENPDADVETLELKLDDAIIRETPSLESGLSLIKVLYVIAPLLGLLGTVVGMIATFQQITLFGTGDPKTMAGGISQALVTTVLGLVVAIPLTLLHSLLSARSRSLIQILEEQSAGMVARKAEQSADY